MASLDLKGPLPPHECNGGLYVLGGAAIIVALVWIFSSSWV